MNPQNMWMYWGLPHKFVFDPDGTVTLKALCGCIWKGKLADLEKITIVPGSCATCTCCAKMALEFEFSEEAFEARKKEGCGCCVCKKETLDLCDFDSFITDTGLAAAPAS